jgi:hypothetical protein
VKRENAAATLRKRGKYRPFIDRRTGETVFRIRGGKWFRRVLQEWDTSGLVRARDSFIPRGWAAAEPDHPPPFVIRAVIDRALVGGDVSGLPGAELADRVITARARADVESIGPSFEPTPGEMKGVLREIADNLDQGRVVGLGPWTAKQARWIRKIELARAKAKVNYGINGFRSVDADGSPRSAASRAVTTEFDEENWYWDYKDCTYGNKQHHIYVRLGHDDVQTRNVRMKDGSVKRVRIQKSTEGRREPGPKPKYGFTMDERTRKAKQRARERGVPFVIENYRTSHGNSDEVDRNRRRHRAGSRVRVGAAAFAREDADAA